MKRLLCAMLTALILISVCACGKEYRDDLNATAVADELVKNLNGQNIYLSADLAYLGELQLPDGVTDGIVRFSEEGNDIDEVGVIRATAETVKNVEKALSDYLKKSYTDNQKWYDSYIPKETPKLRDAEVRVYGNYAVYAILNDADKDAFFAAAETLLSK